MHAELHAREPKELSPFPWTGIVIWIAVSILAVGVRGVRWDETFEHAQVLAGDVVYPVGHPLRVYVTSAFSVQTLASAALLELTSSPLVVCGVRNVLFLLATALPIFLITTALSGRQLWGHLAVVLALRGVYLEFEGSYPIAVWPHVFSNGHIGGGAALIGLFCLATGRLRAGYFLTGAMIAVHLGQAPVLFAVAALLGVREAKLGHNPLLKRVVAPFSMGFAVSLVAWLYTQTLQEPAANVGPYAPQTDEAASVWKTYTEYHDPHRQFPPANGHIVLAAFLLIAGGTAWYKRRDDDYAVWAWLFGYGAIAALVVWGTMAVHAVLGPDIPFLLIGWMPYRLVNHVSPLLLCVLIGAMTGRKAPAILSFVAVLAAIYPFLGPLLGRELFERYVISGEFILFVLIGLRWIATLAAIRESRVFAGIWSAVSVIAFVTLSTVHQFGAAIIAVSAGAVVGTALVARRRDSAGREFDPRLHTLVIVAALSAVSAELLYEEWAARSHLPVSEFRRAAKDYLDQHNTEQQLVAAGPSELLFQAQTGHPVFVEIATSSLISYVPSLGPTIAQMYEDVYGVTFGPATTAPDWRVLWTERTAAEWSDVGDRYSIGFVAAPDSISLDLAPVTKAGGGTLYRID